VKVVECAGHQAKRLVLQCINGVSYNSLDRAYGFSVRCIQTKFGVPATNDPVDPSTQDIAKASSWDSKETGEGFIKSIRRINAS
jgi:hypothetical protein